LLARFSTHRLFLLLLLVSGMALAAREVLDPDVWWHLRTGQYIAQHHAVPHADIYSVSTPGKLWVTHEWLSELVIYALYRTGGWALASLLFAAIIVAAFAICWARSPGKPYLAGLATLLSAMATMATWGVRPQMLSLLLTSIFLALLERHRTTVGWRTLAPLVPLTLLWVNLHAADALGTALILLVAAGWWLDVFFAGDSRERAKHATHQLAIVFALCLAVVPINPSGWRMYLYPIETLRSVAMQQYIVEWFSPNFHAREFQLLALLMLATFAAMALAPERPRPSALLLLLVTAYGALRSARHITLFALVAGPQLAASLASIAGRAPRLNWLTAPERMPSLKLARMHAALALLLVACAAGRIGYVLHRQQAAERRDLPVAATEYLAAERPPGPLFNWYNWGGYLIWKLPQYPVFIDGRADVYGDELLHQVAAAYNGAPQWSTLLDRYGVRTVMLPGQTALATVLRERHEWKKVYEDQNAVIFTREFSTPAAPAAAAVAALTAPGK